MARPVKASDLARRYQQATRTAAIAYDEAIAAGASEADALAAYHAAEKKAWDTMQQAVDEAGTIIDDTRHDRILAARSRHQNALCGDDE